MYAGNVLYFLDGRDPTLPSCLNKVFDTRKAEGLIAGHQITHGDDIPALESCAHSAPEATHQLIHCSLNPM